MTDMKKITRLTALLLCACLLLSFAACNKKENKKAKDEPAADLPSEPDVPSDPSNPATPDLPTDPSTPTNPDVPSTPTTPVVPEKPEEVVRSTEYNTRVKAEEVVLHNGVRTGMSYETVAAITGYTGTKPSGSYFSFTVDGITYSFDQTSGSAFLNYINVTEEATQASIFRDIKIGDNIQDVFKKIPARDTELKKWAIQGIYGYEKTDPKGYADLQFIALSYYQLLIITETSTVKIIFSRVGTNVKWVEINYNYTTPDGTIK
jgi:hypothetical protein